jgi:hypothetical protein
MHHCYPVAGRQQRLAVQGDHEIVVDVDHVCFRRDGLRHLVHVGPGRKPAAQVEKLPDALIGGEVPDRARDERALILRDRGDVGDRDNEMFRRRPVRGEIVFAAQLEFTLSLGIHTHARASWTLARSTESWHLRGGMRHTDGHARQFGQVPPLGAAANAEAVHPVLGSRQFCRGRGRGRRHLADLGALLMVLGGRVDGADDRLLDLVAMGWPPARQRISGGSGR